MSDAKKPICSTCNDTHRMTLHKQNGDEQEVPCTSCPVPCEQCRQFLGPFCAKTPCACSCHLPSVRPESREARLVAEATWGAAARSCELFAQGVRDGTKLRDISKRQQGMIEAALAIARIMRSAPPPTVEKEAANPTVRQEGDSDRCVGCGGEASDYCVAECVGPLHESGCGEALWICDECARRENNRIEAANAFDR